MFTLDTESGFKDMILINGSWGLGEYVVKGIVTPDEYKVFKPTLRAGYDAIIAKRLGSKEKKLIYSSEGISPTKEAVVVEADRHRYVLNDSQVLRLAKWGAIIEEHYGRPMDIEWAFDGETQELYIVQARPETVQARRDINTLEEYVLLEKGKVLCQGASVGAKIGAGKAREFFISGERLPADQAYRIGLVDRVYPDDKLDEEVDKLVKTVLSSGPQAIKMAKELIANVPLMPPDQFKPYTAEMIAALRKSDEGQEGMDAFLNKRKPNWVIE
ncbi:MAG: hypothetical protein GYA46_10430 [candidate division Zixibacteria bacterium]|nr:hypothetical protein [candidate division Zixibacteria bacterium]